MDDRKVSLSNQDEGYHYIRVSKLTGQ